MSSDSVIEKRMYITLSAYLDQLEATERLKPVSQRHSVPTPADIAAGIRSRYPDSKFHDVTSHNIANGKVKHLNLETAQLMLDELWHMGFTPGLSDFIKYVPPEV